MSKINTISTKDIKDGIYIKIIGEVKKDFTKVPVKIWSDESLHLSLLARAILTKLLTLPPRWKICWKQMAKQMETSEKTLRKIITELQDANLLRTFRLKDENGNFERGLFAEVNIDYFISNEELESDDENAEPMCENLQDDLSADSQINTEKIAENEESLPHAQKSTCGDFTTYIDYNLNKDLNTVFSARENQNLQLKAKNHAQENKHTDNALDSQILESAEITSQEAGKDLSKEQISRLKDKELVKASPTKFYFEISEIIKQARTNLKEKPTPQGLNEIGQQAYDDFIAYRVEKNRGKKLTNATLKRIISVFESFSKSGIDLSQAVNKAIERGWSMIYEPSKRAVYPPAHNAGQNLGQSYHKPKAKTAYDRLLELQEMGKIPRDKQARI